MGHKFCYLNITARKLAVLYIARERGYVTKRDIAKLFVFNKRSKKTDAFLRDMLEQGYLKVKRGQEDGVKSYVPTEKAFEAIRAFEVAAGGGSRRTIEALISM